MKLDESNTSRSTAPTLDLGITAAKVIQWQTRQAKVFHRYPLAYVRCLLEQLGMRGDVPLEDLADELGAHLPELEDKERDRFVSLYLRGELDEG